MGFVSFTVYLTGFYGQGTPSLSVVTLPWLKSSIPFNGTKHSATASLERYFRKVSVIVQTNYLLHQASMETYLYRGRLRIIIIGKLEKEALQGLVEV